MAESKNKKRGRDEEEDPDAVNEQRGKKLAKVVEETESVDNAEPDTSNDAVMGTEESGEKLPATASSTAGEKPTTEMKDDDEHEAATATGTEESRKELPAAVSGEGVKLATSTPSTTAAAPQAAPSSSPFPPPSSSSSSSNGSSNSSTFMGFGSSVKSTASNGFFAGSIGSGGPLSFATSSIGFGAIGKGTGGGAAAGPNGLTGVFAGGFGSGGSSSGFGSSGSGTGGSSASSIWSTSAADGKSIFAAKSGFGLGGLGAASSTTKPTDGWGEFGRAEGEKEEEAVGADGSADGSTPTGASSSSSSSAAAAPAANPAAEGVRGLGEPKRSTSNMVVVKGLVNGEEGDLLLLPIPLAKAYKLIKLDGGKRMEWQEMGKGAIKILQKKSTAKSNAEVAVLAEGVAHVVVGDGGEGEEEEEKGKEHKEGPVKSQREKDAAAAKEATAAAAAIVAGKEEGGGEEKAAAGAAKVGAAKEAAEGGEDAEGAGVKADADEKKEKAEKSAVLEEKKESGGEEASAAAAVPVRHPSRLVMRREGTLAVIINVPLTINATVQLEKDVAAIRLSAFAEDGPTTYLIRTKDRIEATKLHNTIKQAVDDLKAKAPESPPPELEDEKTEAKAPESPPPELEAEKAEEAVGDASV